MIAAKCCVQRWRCEMKTIDEIYREMMEIFTEHTGLEAGTGGDLSVRFYAVAAQIHALYLQAAWTERQCFPQTAVGEFLDFHAELRGVERKKAAAAAGEIRFSVSDAVNRDLVIPEGTVCMTAGLVRFETTRKGYLKAGELWVDVPARAVETGASGNAAENTVLTMSVAPVGVAFCSNPKAFAGGADEETDEELRKRVLATYRRLANGANAAYYEQQAMSFEDVSAAVVLPRARGIGTVDVIIAAHGGMPDQELLGQVQSFFDGAREIAVDVQVKAPEILSVDVAVKLKVAPNYEPDGVKEKVREAIAGCFDGGQLGSGVLLARLGAVVFQVPGVENYAFSAPTTDIAVETDVLPVLGNLSVEEMN